MTQIIFKIHVNRAALECPNGMNQRILTFTENQNNNRVPPLVPTAITKVENMEQFTLAGNTISRNIKKRNVYFAFTSAQHNTQARSFLFLF